MNTNYRILHVEDVTTDAEIVQNELQESGINFDILVVDSESEYVIALHEFSPDVILCDNTLPGFNSFEALRILETKKLNIPFIVITATMTEELASDIVKKGADDYIMKDRLKRLPHAIVNLIEKFRFEKELKQLIDQVHENDAFSKNILDQLNSKMLLANCVAGIGIWEYLFNEDKFIADDILLQHYGLTVADFKGDAKELQEYIHPDDKAKIDLEFSNAVKNHTDLNTEFRVTWKDGSVHFIKAVAVTQYDILGNPLRLIGTNQDITADKIAEEKLLITSFALQVALNGLNKIMNSSLDIICTINETGHFVKVSAASEIIFGYKPEELEGTSFMNIVYPDDVELTKKAAEDLMCGVNMTNFENRYIRKDGSVVPIMWSARWDDKDKLVYCVARDATEKKDAEKIVEAERKRYADLFMQAPAFICILKGRNLVYQMSNLSYDSLIGRKDLIGKTVKEVMPEVESQGFLEILDKVYETGDPFTGNEMLIYLDSMGTGNLTEHFINFIYQAYRNNKNEIDSILVFGTDVTKQVKNQKAIEESESRYRSLIEQATDAICIIDPSLKFIDLNAYACHIFGYSKEEFLALSVSDLLLEEDIEKNSLKIDEVKSGKTVRNERRFKRKNGEPLIMEISVRKDDDTGFIMFGHDITERKKADEETKRLANRLSLATKSAAMGIWDWDIQNDHLDWDQGMYNLYDIDHLQFESVYLGWISRLHPEDKVRVNEDIQMAIAGIKQYDTEFRILWRDLSVHHIMATGMIEMDEQGKANRMIGINWDVTDRRSAETRLKELNESLQKQAKELALSNAELEQFAYVTSHDLQEPLRMVTSFLTQLEKKYGNVIDERGKKYIDFAVDGAKRMRQIILDLLEYSKVGKADYILENFDLNELIQEMQILLRTLISEKRAEIIVDKLPQIRAHRAPMYQVFQNLITNALKFARENTLIKIHISVKELQTHWQFAVADNGMGISKEYYDKIFVFFQRLNSKDDYSGSGMGLAITKKIIETLGGEIWLESEEGKGSTFYFTISK